VGQLLRLTWLEIKIFLREPMGVIGTVGIPILMFVVTARLAGPHFSDPGMPRFMTSDLPVFGAVLTAISAVLSLIAIVAIYRDGGILKRLCATPLRPLTILGAQVMVKLLFTALTLAVMILAGRRYYPVGANVPLASFTVALLFATAAIVSMGFVIASLVPTARFAQPIGTVIMYPMLGFSGLFVPVEQLPPALHAVSRALPLTYAVSLLRGVWHGDGWGAHAGDAAALLVTFLLCAALSAKVFRWE